MSHKASDLQELRQVCSAMPLTGEELDEFFVETDQGRNQYQRTRESMERVLLETHNCKLLFCGHRGCGKSTELNKLVEDMGDKIFPVKFSAEDQMQSVNISAEDLLLVICEQTFKIVIEKGIRVKAELLKNVQDYFDQVSRIHKDITDASIAAQLGISADIPIIGPILKVLTKVSGDIKTGTSNEETTVSELRKRPSELLLYVNQTLQVIQSSLPEDQKLLIIVEDLDKMDLRRARPMFVDNVNLLTGIESNIIYTIPIWLFYSPDVNQFQDRFDHRFSLPMIKVEDPEAPSGRIMGFEIVKEIVLKRVEYGVIDDSALNYLILKTGGVLRHVFQVLYTASLASGVSIPIQMDAINYGLNQLRRDLQSQIALPNESIPNGPTSVEELYDRLAKYAKDQIGGKKNFIMPDPINQILLRTLALVEYNGEGWFGVHPLVIEILERLGRL